MNKSTNTSEVSKDKNVENLTKIALVLIAPKQ